MQDLHRLIFYVNKVDLDYSKFRMMDMVLKKKILQFFARDLQLVRFKNLMILKKFHPLDLEVKPWHQFLM